MATAKEEEEEIEEEEIEEEVEEEEEALVTGMEGLARNRDGRLMSDKVELPRDMYDVPCG